MHAIEDSIVSIHLAAQDRPVVILDTTQLALETTLDAVIAAADEAPLRGVILRSDCPRVFVAGRIWGDRRSRGRRPARLPRRGSRIFSKLSSLPCPVAAVDGATLGRS